MSLFLFVSLFLFSMYAFVNLFCIQLVCKVFFAKQVLATFLDLSIHVCRDNFLKFRNNYFQLKCYWMVCKLLNRCFNGQIKGLICLVSLCEIFSRLSYEIDFVACCQIFILQETMMTSYLIMMTFFCSRIVNISS